MWVLIESQKVEKTILEWIQCSCLTFDGRKFSMTAWDCGQSLGTFSIWNIHRIQDSMPESLY